MIPSMLISKDGVSVPLWKTASHVYFEWHEDETCVDFFKRHCVQYVEGCDNLFSQYKINNIEDECIIDFYVYEVKDIYFLISLREIEDIDSLNGSVCVEWNYLNVLKFIAEYGLPFSNENISSF